jgi:hypothetical protein
MGLNTFPDNKVDPTLLKEQPLSVHDILNVWVYL